MTRRTFGPNPVLAAARRANAAKATAARWPDGPPPIRHGASTTQSARCRTQNGTACPTCRAADATRARDARARRAEAGLPEDDPRHGTVGGYTNHGCRCEPCTAAARPHSPHWSAPA